MCIWRVEALCSRSTRARIDKCSRWFYMPVRWQWARVANPSSSSKLERVRSPSNLHPSCHRPYASRPPGSMHRIIESSSHGILEASLPGLQESSILSLGATTPVPQAATGRHRLPAGLQNAGLQDLLIQSSSHRVRGARRQRRQPVNMFINLSPLRIKREIPAYTLDVYYR